MTATLEYTLGVKDCSALVVAMAQGPTGPVPLSAPGLADEALLGLGEALRAVQAIGAVDEVVRLPGKPHDLPPLILTGVGANPLTVNSLRRAAGAALRAAGATRVCVAFPSVEDPVILEGVALGAALGAYRHEGRPTRRPEEPTPERITLAVSDSNGAKAALHRAGVLADGVLLARRLTDAPPGQLPPGALADEARRLLVGTEVAVEVLDEAALRQGGYGGIIGVGMGSRNPPRLVRLTYSPEQAAGHLALVGKGITFDSGGLSLKSATGMASMKMDMAGAAVVLAATRALAALGSQVRITAYLALAENMPGGGAQRPGDVVTAYGGRTVEVLNTDAEGRLVMMDALARAAEDLPDAIIDIATLTGAQIVALGTRIAGLMANDDDWRAQVQEAAGAVGELVWPMPIPEEMQASLESAVADLANIGERNGSMMTAAAFLREFVPAGLPWAHLDIAGPAYNEGSPWAWNAKGATGFGVRTLVEVAERVARRAQA
jgi:leucyl aminopeptidase